MFKCVPDMPVCVCAPCPLNFWLQCWTSFPVFAPPLPFLHCLCMGEVGFWWALINLISSFSFELLLYLNLSFKSYLWHYFTYILDYFHIFIKFNHYLYPMWTWSTCWLHCTLHSCYRNGKRANSHRVYMYTFVLSGMLFCY